MNLLCRTILLLFILCTGVFAQQTNKNFRGLAGTIYEAEDWSTPHTWTTNEASATEWRLWTTEGAGKRSGDASLVSPKIPRDREKPEDGAPVLHTHITGIAKGAYRAWLGPTTRPLAYSLDGGKTWLKSQSSETPLGIFTIKDGAFDLWVDDRFADPSSIGSSYYDYVRLESFVPPTLSKVAAFALPDGSTQISWISSTVAPASIVECEGRQFPETETEMRNHRVVIDGLPAKKTCTAIIRPAGSRPVSVKFVSGQPSHLRRSKQQTIELTVAEPTSAQRQNWPVTSGVPFAQATLATADHAALFDVDGKPVAAQFEEASLWPDGSVKWLWVTFCTDTKSDRATKFQLRIGNRVAPKQQPAKAVAVRESGEGIDIDNGSFSMRVAKNRFALFDNVAVDGERVTGEPTGGNARILDGSGKAYFAQKADKVVIEEHGPIRAVVRAEGDFTAEDGSHLFRWRARYFVAAGQPWVRLNWTIGNSATNVILTNIQQAGIRIPIAANGPVSGALNGEPAAAIADDHSTWVLQDKDDHFTASASGKTSAGEHASGCASVTDGKRTMQVVVKDFWQTYPKGIAVKPDGLHVRVLPALPSDAFARESENAEDLIRLYYCYDRGQYRIKRGLEFSTDLYVRFGIAKTADDVAWFNHPLFAAAPARHYCDSGVFGFAEPRQTGVFDQYEKMTDEGFAQIDKNRVQKHEYGWMNFGDWHGERHFNWGNHEYDMMGAMALQFARTGDLKWLWRAEECARHSTSIDTIHYPWQGQMAGRVYAHSVGHVGGFFDMADPRFQRLGNVFGLKKASQPNPFVAGSIDPGGHIFQPGNFRVGFLTGERRYVEVASMVCAAQAAWMTPNFRFGIERAAGWPLMNAVAAYEGTGNPFFLNAARLYVEKIVADQTERGDWGLPHGPPECLHEPPHAGGKAFAAGVLLNGLVMFDGVAPSAEVKRCIVRNAHWLERYSWNKTKHSFRYIDTCPTFDSRGGNGGTDFLVSSGLAYACLLDDDPALRELLLDSMSRALGSKAKVGKDFIQDIRQTPHALAIMHRKLGITELRPPSEAASPGKR